MSPVPEDTKTRLLIIGMTYIFVSQKSFENTEKKLILSIYLGKDMKLSYWSTFSRT